MPTLAITTNVPGDRLKASEALKELSSAVAKLTGKPESYVCVSITQDVPLSFGGSEAPAAHATLTSIGGLGPNNASLSKSISGVLQAKFGIPAARLYISFVDVAGTNMGWNGATF